MVKRIVIGICVILLVLGLFIIGYLLGSKQTSFVIGNIIKPSIKVKLKPVNPKTEYKKTKTISSDGGRISIVNDKGIKITLNVPAGALDKSTDISLAPLNDSPLESNNQYASNMSVLIDPVELDFISPATLIFDFNSQNDGPPPQAGMSLEDYTENEIIPSALPLVNFEDEELTPDERQRRSQSTVSFPSDPPLIVTTDSSSENAGTNINFVPSNRNGSTQDIEVIVYHGGSYGELGLSEAEIVQIIEYILSNPNSTLEDITQALAAAQGLGNDQLTDRSIDLLNKFLNEAIGSFIAACSSQSNTLVSKKAIVLFQAYAQSQGLAIQAKQFEDLLENCQKKYSVNYVISSTWNRTDTFTASTCGFVDDLWKGVITIAYDCGGGGSTNEFNFNFPSQGGQTTNIIPWIGGVSVCGRTGANLIGGPLHLTIYYPGGSNAFFSFVGLPSQSVEIKKEDSCTTVVSPSVDELPPLVPIYAY